MSRTLRWAAALAAFLFVVLADPQGALRSTLFILPWVAAALDEIASVPGIRRLSTAATTIEAVALVALAALALRGGSLGLVFWEEVSAAGLFTLLLLASTRRALALSPLLTGRLPRRPAWPFFALPLVVYLAILPWATERRPPNGDEPYYLLVAHSLAYDFDADLANNYAAGDSRQFVGRALEPQPGDPVGSEGQIYSRHNLMLPLLLAPAYRLAGARGTEVAMALLTAALAWWTLRLGRHYVRERPGEATLVWWLLAVFSPLLLYSHQIWVEVPAALACVVSLDHLRELRYDRRWTPRRWLGMGLPLVFLPLLKIRFLLLAVPLLALAWWHGGRPRKPLIAMGLVLAAVTAGILVHNTLVYGNPLKIHSTAELGLLSTPLSAYADGGFGLLFDGAFGLVASFPIWLLLVPGLVAAARRLRPLLFDSAVVSFPYLLVVASRREWYGGWSPPFRYALVGLPALALALVPLLAARRRWGARVLLGALGALTLALTLVWLIEPGWTYNFADGRTLLLDRLEAATHLDLGRLVPSMVRPRPATWAVPFGLGLGALVLWHLPSRPAPSRASAAGVALALALVAAALPLASAWPTARIELEDPWVAKSGGHVHPDPWVIERPRHRGGWVLREGETATARVVRGGDSLALALELEWVRNTPSPLALEVRAGERLLARWDPVEPRHWERLELGPFPFPTDAPLVFAVVGPPGAPPLNGLILDRAELSWR